MEAKYEGGSGYDRHVDPEVAARRNELFKKLIPPYYNLIKWLCRRYSASPTDIRENYSLVLSNLYKGIETYNPEKDIRTWIHICSKRFIVDQDRKRVAYKAQLNMNHDISDESMDDFFEYSSFEHQSANLMDETNYREFYSDDVLNALDSLNPIHRDALILQQAGYSLKEIAEIEFKKGRLKSKNIDTVKSRLFLARKTLMKKLNRNGTRKTD